MTLKSSVILIFPALLAAGLVFSVFFGYVSTTMAILAFMVSILIYLLPVSIVLGFFQTPEVKEISRGPFNYYYVPYQDAYWNAAKKFHAILSPEDSNLIMDKVEFLAWYWDVPNYLKDPNTARSLFGFVVKENDKRTKEILQRAKFRCIELPKWQAVEAFLRVFVDLTYSLAPMILLDPIFKYVKKRYPEMHNRCVTYEACAGEYMSYGYIVSSNQDFFNKLAPYPEPEMNEKGREALDKFK